jgi:heat shock protein HtpX
MWLQIRLYLLLGLMFAIVYGMIVAGATYMGVGSVFSYMILALVLLFFQYMIGPKMVEWTMHVRYVSEKESPKLHKMVSEMAKKAKIPMPKIGISNTGLPNAFAFGRSLKDGRVCVTSGILNLLDENELKAVLGHELSHIKNRDVLVITMLSAIPMFCWYLAWNFMFSRNRDNAALIGMSAFLMYFITNLLVLYGSRIREFYADKGSVELGNDPHHLASALYKLVYGSASIPIQYLKEVEGVKAFFANDPSRAHREIVELKALDQDLSGHIDKSELEKVRHSSIKITRGDKMMEILSTHPNMLKRIKHLSHLSKK